MLLNLLNSHYRSTHKEFHNKHLGSSCFIIGGGHSIKYMDIKKFKDELIIGVNLSPFHVDFKKLNMLYNVIIQPRIFVPWFLKRQIDKDFSKVANLFKEVSRESSTIFFVHNAAKVFNFKQANWRAVPSYIWDPGYELRAMGAIGGAFYAGLGVARLMGFKNVTLIGFDAFTLRAYSNLRWYEYGCDDLQVGNDETANDFLRFLICNGMQISTMGLDTEAAMSELHYLDYKKLYDRNPTYKENYELLSPEAYEALKTYAHLKI